jgi:predicted nucleic acid-binding protein
MESYGYVGVGFAQVLTIAHQTNMYAYDAYFLDCAIRHSAPLMTLDRKLLIAAKTLGIDILEV